MCLDAPDLRMKTTEKTGGPAYGPFSFVFALLCNLCVTFPADGMLSI